MSINTIIKSDGSVVQFEPEKLNKWGKYASNHDVSWSDITLKAYRKCYDGCTTRDIHQAMIDSCVEMEDEKHLKMAGRLLIGAIYKEAHGGFKSIPTIKDFYKSMVERNLWVEMDYTDSELEELESVIDHDKNMSDNYSYTALKQMRDKYVSQDLITRTCHESPQFMFMGVALQSMERQPKDRRIHDVSKMYEYLSDLKVNLSTPMLVNLRTPKKGLASCCVYTTNDNAESLSVGDHIAYMMTCSSAGIGSHLTTRSKGDPIRNGAVVHQGKLPYLRVIQSAVHANKQACYDDKTQVLTNSGFKLFKDLNDDDLVAQVHSDGSVDFIEPINGFVYDFEGDLVKFTTYDGGEFLVTDNHKMVVADMEGSVESVDFEKSSDFLSLIEAGDLNVSDDKYFLTGGNTKNLDSSDLLKEDMVATWLDTSVYDVGSRGEALGFCKSKEEHVEIVLEELEVEFTKEDIKVDGFEVELVAFIVDIKKLKTKYLNRLDTMITRLGYSQLKEMVEYIKWVNLDSEGKLNISPSIKNGNKLLPMLTSVSGGAFTMINNLETGDFQYDVSSDARTLIPTSTSEKSLVPYKGKVYCVEVPTNMLIVRRDVTKNTLVCGNSRGGANTTYFSVLDPEIMDLLVLKNPTTVLQKRIRDIDYALNVNRLFVEKVARNEEWFTLSYYYAPDLHDAFYSEDYELFKSLYEKYKDHEHSTKYKARDIAIKALTESVETGRLYIHYVDEANRHTPFAVGSGANDDKIYSSNLCVAPETKILTKDGYQEISTLKDVDVEVWNGEEWSNVTVRQTGENQLLMKIGFSNGSEIECTPYHKFYLNNCAQADVYTGNIKENGFGGTNEVRAGSLALGDVLETYTTKWDNCDGMMDVILSNVYVTKIEITGRRDDTYCATEPKRNRLIFNGIETGNCLEVSLVTKGFTNMPDLYGNDPDGEIGLCSLSSIVMGRVTDEEYADVAYYVSLLVDNTIDIMDFPFPSLERTAKARRSIGIGMTNMAHLIAEKSHETNGRISYTTKEGKEFIHYLAERHAFHLYSASLRLGKEKGNAEWMHKTKYPQGWLPIDTYNKNVDSVVANELSFDWEGLRQGIIDNGGIRNSTLIAIPPNESSSLLTNTTNSIYPVRSLKVIKTSGTNRNILLAPDFEKLKKHYDIAWTMDSKDLIELYAIVQKFTDQGISADLYVSYKDSELVSTKQILSDFIYMMKMGCKSRYYINSQSGVDADYFKKGEAEIINADDFCDSCVL